jgi:hypothetical protein
MVQQLTSCELQADFGECLHRWFFGSTTAFYDMHDDLQLPWWFGALCFSFSFAGCMMLATEPKWSVDNLLSFPYRTFAYILIFIQGPLSFMADYVNMTHDSVFHVIDRSVAVPMLTLEVFKICAMFQYGRTCTMIIYASLCAFAIYCFLMSQLSLAESHGDGFIFWHSLWHVYPLFVSVLFSIDVFYLGQDLSKYPASAMNKSDNLDAPLLSTLLMGKGDSAHTKGNLRSRTNKSSDL